MTTVATLPKGEEWIPTDGSMMNYLNVIITLGRECRDWGNMKADLAVKQLIEDNARDDDVVYTDGSVQRGEKSGWGFLANAHVRVVAERSGAYRTTTSSMRMEVEAVTAALHWISGTSFTGAVVVSDSQSMLHKIQKGRFRYEWMSSIEVSNLQRLTWIYCPGHAGVYGNERADRLASTASIVGELKMDKGDILRSLRDSLLDEDTKIDVESIKRFKQFGVTRCSSRTGCLRGRVRGVFNQRATGTISMHTLRYLLGETEHLWVCPECNDVSLVTNNQ